MSPRHILLTDDLKRNFSGPAYQSSLALRAIASNLSERLSESMKMVFVDKLGENIEATKNISNDKIRQWKERYDRLFFRLNTFLPAGTEFILRAGSAAPEILHLIHEVPRPELVVMGTRGLRGLKKLFLGSVADDVIRHSERPVLVVGPLATTKALNFAKVKTIKILLLTDLEKTSKPAENYAASLAKRLGASLTLCHSVGDQIQKLKMNVYSTGYIPFDFDDTIQTMRKEARKKLEKKTSALKNKNLNVSSKLILLENPLDTSVREELKKGYDLIIMGTHSRGIIASEILGSSARRTILNSPVPVIVLK